MPKPIVQELRVKDLTKGGFNSINRSINVLKAGVAGLGAALSVRAFANFTTQAIDAADNIAKLSTRLGASTEALSQYQLVAERSGVSFNTLTTGLQRLTRRVSEAADGSGEAKGALAELGLVAADIENLSVDQQFELIADAMQGVEGQADKVRIAMRLFDTEGVALLQTMEGGSAAIREVRDAADALGTTLDKNTAKAAEEANNALSNLSAVFRGLGQQMLVSLAPAVTAVANWLTNTIPKAVNAATRAFAVLGNAAVSIGSSVTDFFAYLSADAADLAGNLGLNKVESALRTTAQDYANLSASIESYRVDVGQLTTAQNLLNDATGKALNLSDFQRKGLVQEIALQKQRAAQAKKTAAEYQRRIESINQYVASVRKEADTLGFTNAQLREYELRQLGASAQTIKATLALQQQVDAYEKQQDAAEAAAQAAQQLEEFARQLTRSVNPAQTLAEELDKIERAFDEGLISADTYGEAIFAAMDKAEKASKKAGDEIKKLKPLSEELGPVIGSAFEDAIVEGEKFSDVLKGLEKDLLRILTRRIVTRPLIGAFENLLGGLGGSSGIFSFLSPRAVGGPAARGQPYKVGENGPELFVPSTYGRIEPNAGGNTINVVVNGVADAASFMRNKAQVARAANIALRQAQAAV